MRRPGPLTADGLTQAFSDVRDASGFPFSANPPSFHEMRSLAGRLYEIEYGAEFAQKLLGHKNMSMTKKISRCSWS
ncbi:tyrosine-type recombinase/integrase [Sodalis ligni]|uniref:tyrosine-type recombinase/integrase n=1 Tax=Sodalis ligni TaxID=2697027 RepID=UPI001FB75AF6|nr:tyrosine-type recombinase/integrase [Sodalis ligni]